MGGRADHWSISTDDGVVLDADELSASLAVHHERLIETWQGFTTEQWEHESRNTEWSVHQTVRHQADVMVRVAASMNGQPMLDENGFDPMSTPDEWLGASDGESPQATVERFAAAAPPARQGISDRLAAGDDSQNRTVYGPAHWTVNVVHVLWDSWLHERDVLLALGQPSPCSEREERLVGLYGLLMALVPSNLMQQSISATVRLSGIGVRTVEVSCGAGALFSAEVPTGEAAVSGSLPAAIDALAGRGGAVADVLSGAPDELGFLAGYFNS